ncbi:MAG TPA: DUF4253 domain-containing protein [Gemmatimonadaceae bacterium]|nr:DUF4253 domain-containing protein [Gemmatimonadaceae bacterium]
MLPLSSLIYACVTAFITFFILRLLGVPRWPAGIVALTSPAWFSELARAIGTIPWAWIIGLGLLVPYVLGPSLVRVLSRWPAHPDFEPYDPRDDEPPAPIGSFFEDIAASLSAEGYVHELWLVQRGFVQHTTSRLRVFVNAREQSAAIAYAIVSDDPRIAQFVSYIDFITFRRDGRHRVTNNAPRPSPYAPYPPRVPETFARVRDPARLARLHRELVRNDGDHAPLPEEFRQDPLRFAADAVRSEMLHQVTTGYLSVDEEASQFRCTLRGAAMMTWKMLPPASWFLAWRMRRRADQLLAVLDARRTDEHPLVTPADRSTGSPALLPLTSAAAVLIVVAILRLPELFGGVSLVPAGMRSESFALPPGFTVSPDFASAMRQLESLASAPADSLFASGPDAVRGAWSGGWSIPVRSTLLTAFLEAVQPSFLASGHYVFRAERNFGIAGEADRVGLLPTADQFEVVRLVGTRGREEGPGNGEIVAWLRALHAAHPFALTGVHEEWISGRFSAQPADPRQLANAILAFCPDVGVGEQATVEGLAREIVRRRELACWWD